MATSSLRFLGSSDTAQGARALLLGLPWDGTASYRRGSALGPNAIRSASDSIETYDPRLDLDLADLGPYADLGDIGEFPADPAGASSRIERELAELPGELPLLGLGGEHSVTPPLVAHAKRRHPDLAVIVVDAHADLRASYEGTPHSHACSSRRILELVGPESLALIGIRSGTREEYELMAEHQLHVEASAEAFDKLLTRWGGRPLYLSVDLDGLDPAIAPGTGTVEPGGLLWQQIEELFIALRGQRLVGGDLVELAPALDPTGRSDVVAARIVRMLLGRLLQG